MLVTVSALILAAAITSGDSVRALRLAHRAQSDFESLRRGLLPHETLVGVTGCDAVVGRYCYLQQVSSSAPRERRGRRGANAATDDARQPRRHDPR